MLAQDAPFQLGATTEAWEHCAPGAQTKAATPWFAGTGTPRRAGSEARFARARGVRGSAAVRYVLATTVDLSTHSHQWQPVGPYLNTASYGLPPQVGWDALQAALEDWHCGRTSWEHWGDSTERARQAFARLGNVPVESVAVGATVSELVALVALAVEDGSRILAVEGDFTSLLFPFAAQAGRGVDVRSVPLDALSRSIEPGTRAVVFSTVQSATGAVADVDAIIAAAAEVGALTVVDATQAFGWLPVDAGRFDAVACAGYKWLMAPRGTAYLYLGDRLQDVTPAHAGWYAGEDVHGSYYGLPMRLASSARRFDTSPAWFSWVGAAPALELLEEIGIETIRAHNVALANRFRAGLGLEPSDSSIVTASVHGAETKLERAKIRASTRAGQLRVSFHLYNTEADVDAALHALQA